MRSPSNKALTPIRVLFWLDNFSPKKAPRQLYAPTLNHENPLCIMRGHFALQV